MSDTTEKVEVKVTETPEYKMGVEIGIRAACKIILGKLNDKTKSIPVRIANVKSFCNNPFGVKKEKSEDK